MSLKPKRIGDSSYKSRKCFKIILSIIIMGLKVHNNNFKAVFSGSTGSMKPFYMTAASFLQVNIEIYHTLDCTSCCMLLC